ncbi:helix-turn-helix domain-containing protein [Lysinibacillus capsici]|uniref:helix-turn-helix domain-containing protein n=1 Tax=Lysinibacillus capsici TaxID=2115968 RepID=UPI000E201EB6|nr:helix-turn-helix domain-containing protein [Lysinibacillus capsici]RDV26295.1 helix-turn-helix domain-containing protein [Lysinibacillus capsici]
MTDTTTKQPFVIVYKQILNDTRITRSSDITVYCALSAYADNITRQSWASIATIAKMARCSESSVRRALKTLSDLGYVRVDKQYDRIGKQTSNLYTVLNL